MADQGGIPVLPEQDFTPEFVVPVNRESVARARRRVVRILRISACVQVIGGGLIIACGGAVAFLTRRDLGDNWLIAMFIGAPGLIMLYGARSGFAGLRRIKRTWAAAGIPEVAMHLSHDGMRCGMDGAPPLFLPWPTVVALHLKSWRGQKSLLIQLAPGVTAATPGVIGLDHPDVQRTLRRKQFGFKGLRFAVTALRRSPEEIDQALAWFTRGRVRIHQ